MTSSTQFTAIVPAAGVGARMQADRPKQYLQLAGKTVLEHTLHRLISHPQIEHIIVPLSAEDDFFDHLEISRSPWITRVEGGKERADSVLAGLNHVQGEQWVLVHDAARPCIEHKDLNALLRLADCGDTGGILATPVKDTMKRASDQFPNTVASTESRDNLWHALTPQFFPLLQLRRALTNALMRQQAITDEASAIEWAGGEVRLVEGSSANIKITRPEDLALANFYLQQGVT